MCVRQSSRWAPQLAGTQPMIAASRTLVCAGSRGEERLRLIICDPSQNIFSGMIPVPSPSLQFLNCVCRQPLAHPDNLQPAHGKHAAHVVFIGPPFLTKPRFSLAYHTNAIHDPETDEIAHLVCALVSSLWICRFWCDALGFFSGTQGLDRWASDAPQRRAS